MKLSIIISVYNEEENVGTIYNSIRNLFEGINYEIIYVNDGSTDKTGKVLEAAYKSDKEHVKVINLSRNFGKDAAIYAGLEAATGEYTAIIDGDMQQNPKYLLQMLTFLDKNDEYDQVQMINKVKKEESKKIIYKIIDKFSDIKYIEDASDFRMFRKNVKEAALKLPESNRFSKGIFCWIGFNTKYMEYDVSKRNKGVSKYDEKKYLKYVLDGVIGYSVKPLKIAGILGLVTTIISLLCLIYAIIKLLVAGTAAAGFPLVFFLILFIGGIQLTSISLLGEYLSKTFIETKNRPIYVEKSRLGFDEEIL